MAGNVAMQQALRFHFHLSFRNIAKVMEVHHRTIWEHCAPGNTHVRAWGQRTDKEQAEAIEAATPFFECATGKHQFDRPGYFENGKFAFFSCRYCHLVEQ